MDSFNEKCINHDIFLYPIKAAFESVSVDFNESCDYVMQLPYKDRCEFVMKNKDCSSEAAILLNSFHWVFCYFSEEYSFIGLIITVLCLIMIFITAAFIADGYISTNLAIISRSLNLPDSIAGVTLLALGNGMPDLFTAFAGAELNQPEILFAGLTGAGLFDVSIAAGYVIFVRPFHIDTYCWWNLLFYLCNYSIFFCGFYFKNLTIWHSVGILIIYAIYGLFTVAHTILGPLDDREMIVEEEETKLIDIAKARRITIPERIPGLNRATLQNAVEILKTIERERIYRDMGYRLSARRSDDFGYSWTHPKELFFEFKNALDFTISYQWRTGTTPERFFIILQLPWLIGLKFLLPAVVPGIKYNHGWCKLMVMINVLIYPCLLLFCFGVIKVTIGPFPIWLYALIGGFLVSALIFFHTRTRKKPKYHTVLAYAGFIGSIAMARLLSTEIVVYLQTIGARLSISSSCLSLSILSWGNCITDFVSAASLSKQGLQNMGYSSLYGGPMFNCSVGITIVYIIVYLEGKPLKPFYGAMGPVGSLFVFISLISTIILMPILSFEGRRVMGLYLMLLYSMFFILCILMETIIHPFGTEQSKNKL